MSIGAAGLVVRLMCDERGGRLVHVVGDTAPLLELLLSGLDIDRSILSDGQSLDDVLPVGSEHDLEDLREVARTVEEPLLVGFRLEKILVLIDLCELHASWAGLLNVVDHAGERPLDLSAHGKDARKAVRSRLRRRRLRRRVNGRRCVLRATLRSMPLRGKDVRRLMDSSLSSLSLLSLSLLSLVLLGTLFSTLHIQLHQRLSTAGDVDHARAGQLAAGVRPVLCPPVRERPRRRLGLVVAFPVLLGLHIVVRRCAGETPICERGHHRLQEGMVDEPGLERAERLVRGGDGVLPHAPHLRTKAAATGVSQPSERRSSGLSDDLVGLGAELNVVLHEDVDLPGAQVARRKGQATVAEKVPDEADHVPVLPTLVIPRRLAAVQGILRLQPTHDHHPPLCPTLAELLDRIARHVHSARDAQDEVARRAVGVHIAQLVFLEDVPLKLLRRHSLPLWRLAGPVLWVLADGERFLSGLWRLRRWRRLADALHEALHVADREV